MKIIGTGLSGLVGSRMVEHLGSEFDFEDISRKTGTDILDKEAVFTRIKNSSSDFVIHSAAYTQVDQAEKEKDLGEESLAWKINVNGTENVLEACEATNKHLIHISTDMVFPGTKKLPERYVETDNTGAVGWYAKTKEEAEKIVLQSKIPFTILRIAYPYLANSEKNYVHIFKSLLEQNKSFSAVEDHYFTPLFLDDLSDVLKIVINQKLTGIYHVGGKDSLSPFLIAQKIADVFNLDKNLVKPTTREIFFKDKAPRAFNLSLDSSKIEALGVKLKDFLEGLSIIRQQIK